MYSRVTERFSFDQANRVSGVSGLVLRTLGGERACDRSCWILEHFHLTSCFNFDLSGEQDSVHS